MLAAAQLAGGGDWDRLSHVDFYLSWLARKSDHIHIERHSITTPSQALSLGRWRNVAN